MVELVASAATAAWLGILTSISPCPLATNIAAVSYIGRQPGGSRSAFRTSLVYAAGRMVAYVLIAGLLVFGLLSAPSTSHALQKWMIRILGPVLLAAAVLVSGWVALPSFGARLTDRAQARIAGGGAWGAALLGFVFALTFCPVSAALFFGALLPIAIENRSAVLLPVSYGLGTALPVLAVGMTVAAGAAQAARLFDKATRFETWGRRITAALFAGVGLWFTVRWTFGWR